MKLMTAKRSFLFPLFLILVIVSMCSFEKSASAAGSYYEGKVGIENGNFETGTVTASYSVSDAGTSICDVRIVDKGNDPYVGISKVFQGEKALKIGDEFVLRGEESTKSYGEPYWSGVSQQFPVPTQSANSILSFNFAAVAEDSKTDSYLAPGFDIQVECVGGHGVGHSHDIFSVSYRATSIFGTPSGWINSGIRSRRAFKVGTKYTWLYIPWQRVSVDMGEHAGHVVQITFRVNDSYPVQTYWTYSSYAYIDDIRFGKEPIISSLNPGSGSAGTEVKIKGSNFGDLQGNNEVKFAGVRANIISWSYNSIIAKVPTGAVTGDVYVYTDEGKSNSSLFTITPPPATVRGNINDGHGNNLLDTKIELYKGARFVTSAYCDYGGNYSFNVPLQKAKYKVRAKLVSSDGRMKIIHVNKEVWAEKNFDSDPATNPIPVVIDFNMADTAKIDNASISKTDLDNCSSVWFYICKNYELAKALGYDLNFDCPVVLFETGKRAYFSFVNEEIHIQEDLVDDDTADKFPPPWDYKKNRETHEFGHALMWRFMEPFWVAPCFTNHGGYGNDNTGDSMAEGFAEFWTLVFARLSDVNTPFYQYDEWGDIVNDRRMAWAPIDTAHPTQAVAKYPLEEFAACGTLFDIYNSSGRIKRGFFDLTQDIEATGGMADLGTMKDLYDRLIGEGIPSASLNPAFTSHGFFGDANGNWQYDIGEGVGGAGHSVPIQLYVPNAGKLNIAARPNRPQRPYDENSFVKVNLNSSNSTPLSDTKVNVAISYDDPAKRFWDYEYSTNVNGSTGLVFVPMPDDAIAVITARGPTGDLAANSISFTSDDFKTAVANAGANGYFAGANFTVKGASAMPKPNFVFPKSGGFHKGNVLVNANCPGAPEKVEFWVDGYLVKSVVSAPYSYLWKTKAFKDAWHLLSVRSYNHQGKYSDASSKVFLDRVVPKVKLNVRGFRLRKPGTYVRFTLIDAGRFNVKVTLMVKSGKKVIAKLLNNKLKLANSGGGITHAARWNGKNLRNQKVKAGKYVIELSAIDPVGFKRVARTSIVVTK